jgi:hypothetical protein
MRIRLNLIKILDKLHESAISKPTFYGSNYKMDL